MSLPHTVVIVGGGISGLATAFSLQEQAAAGGLSIRCTVLESGSTWGGKIVTLSKELPALSAFPADKEELVYLRRWVAKETELELPFFLGK